MSLDLGDFLKAMYSIKKIKSCFKNWILTPVMLSVNCQLDRIKKVLGDGLPSMLVRDYLNYTDCVTIGGVIPLLGFWIV